MLLIQNDHSCKSKEKKKKIFDYYYTVQCSPIILVFSIRYRPSCHHCYAWSTNLNTQNHSKSFFFSTQKKTTKDDVRCIRLLFCFVFGFRNVIYPLYPLQRFHLLLYLHLYKDITLITNNRSEAKKCARTPNLKKKTILCT